MKLCYRTREDKMREKNFNIFGLTLLFGIVLLSMNFVSAEVTNFTILSPVANANVTGTFTVITNVTNLTGAVNLTIRNASSGALLCSSVNGPGPTNVTCAFSTTGLSDNQTNIFNITVVETGGVAANSSNVSGIAIDNSAPTIFFANSTLSYVNATVKGATNLTINISLVDNINLTRASACIVNVNGTNQTLPMTIITIPAGNSTYGTCNTTTLSLKGLGYGNQTINIYAGRNTTGWNGNLFGVLATYTVFLDANAPSIDLSATSLSQDTITLAIETSDPVSGVSSCTVDRAGATVSGTSSVTESGLSCATSYTYTVTCTDGQGNSAAAAETFSTNSCGSSSGSSGGASASPVVKTVTGSNSFTLINPGVASIAKDFNADIGVKQISIEVNNKAQDVQVTVTKYDGKPAAVSVAKSGDVKQYLQINVLNIQNKLDKATVQFRVEKAKTSNKNGIVVSKFDEIAKQWNDLTTTFASEDDKYYYYDVELKSFSYFAISEKAVASPTKTGTAGGETTTATEGGSRMWLWIILGVVVVVVVAWLLMRKK